MTRIDMLAAERLDRYRSLVPDWEAFVDALSRPLPLCVWTNTLRTHADEVARHLEREGIDAEPLAWYPGAFKGPSSARAGRSLPFAAGLFHIQEEVSLLPVVLLAPRSGERVMDLCSAPGNKTAQIAVAMANSGTVIANDRDAMRARGTRGILDRLGVVNATLTTFDASNLPDAVGRFDRVLADVPCTCEGTTRKHVDALLQSGEDASLSLHRRQLAILRKAIQLCRPGGLIAYATCTYAPEENEMVIDAALREHEGAVELVPARIDGVTTSPGVTEWNGHGMHRSLEHAMRVWPHQNDSGGFFVALLCKREGGSGPDGSGPDVRAEDDHPDRVPDAFAVSERERQRWIDLLRDRFGIDAGALARVRLHQPNNKYVAAVAADHRSVRAPEPVSIGMPLIRVGLRYPKLTTAGARMLGRHATRNVVRTTAAQIRAYVEREEFTLTAEQRKRVTGTGYVLVEHAEMVLGVGLCLEGDRDNEARVRSMFPSVLSAAVAE